MRLDTAHVLDTAPVVSWLFLATSSEFWRLDASVRIYVQDLLPENLQTPPRIISERTPATEEGTARLVSDLGSHVDLEDADEEVGGGADKYVPGTPISSKSLAGSKRKSPSGTDEPETPPIVEAPACSRGQTSAEIVKLRSRISRKVL